jgi:hypothetical protein
MHAQQRVAIVPDCWLWLPALCSIGASIAAALAHQPAELAHDRGLRRLAPERQAGDRDDDQQQLRERKDREIGSLRRPGSRLHLP